MLKFIIETICTPMNNLNFGFEDLELWKKTRLFKVELKKLTQTFPPEKKYRFADQILRSSRSINA